MKSVHWISVVAAVVFTGAWISCQHAHATFHRMQIEQVIGGVNGDTTAQAIQLRMITNNQQFVSGGRVRAWDAAGANPVTVIDMTTDVAVGLTGRRVLITTAAFGNYTDVPLVSDFTMTNPIPASYLSAGRLTFENNFGTINYWSLSWGGAGYTGSNAGSTLNDVGTGGDYGPSFAGALPSTTLQALQFTGAVALSTTNAADYALTAGAATFVNNANASFSLVAALPDSADFDGDGDVDGDDFLTWQRGTGGPGAFADGDANHNGTVDGDDLDIWETQYGTEALAANVAAIPEPQTMVLMLCGLLALGKLCLQR